MERMRGEVRAMAPIANAIVEHIAVRRHCGAPTQPHRSTTVNQPVQSLPRFSALWRNRVRAPFVSRDNSFRFRARREQRGEHVRDVHARS